MTKPSRAGRPQQPTGGYFDQARDELFSHILRCGVLEATVEHQNEWFDDTMEYLTERYDQLSDQDLVNLRKLGERYCQPVISRTNEVEVAST